MGPLMVHRGFPRGHERPDPACLAVEDVRTAGVRECHGLDGEAVLLMCPVPHNCRLSYCRYLPPSCAHPFYQDHKLTWYGFIVLVAVVHGCVFLLSVLGLVARIRIGRRAAKANMSGSSVVAPTSLAVINNPRDRVRLWALAVYVCVCVLVYMCMCV